MTHPSKNNERVSADPSASEVTVSIVVGPQLSAWLEQLQDAVTRVKSSKDAEAVHDLRVTLRRTRSLLRVVRTVYGQFHVNLIRMDFKRVADATSALRDAEVLRETLGSLELDDSTKKAVSAFLRRHACQEQALRTAVVRLLDKGALDYAMAHLRALLALPCKPNRDRKARGFCRKVVLNAQAAIDESRNVDVSDSAAMHRLRIFHKRLRYAVEAFQPMLPPELRAWRDVAAQFQKVLGDLHDTDVARVVIGGAPMPPHSRDKVLEALSERRAKIAARYLQLVGKDYHAAHRSVLAST